MHDRGASNGSPKLPDIGRSVADCRECLRETTEQADEVDLEIPVVTLSSILARAHRWVPWYGFASQIGFGLKISRSQVQLGSSRVGSEFADRANCASFTDGSLCTVWVSYSPIARSGPPQPVCSGFASQLMRPTFVDSDPRPLWGSLVRFRKANWVRSEDFPLAGPARVVRWGSRVCRSRQCSEIWCRLSVRGLCRFSVVGRWFGMCGSRRLSRSERAAAVLAVIAACNASATITALAVPGRIVMLSSPASRPEFVATVTGYYFCVMLAFCRDWLRSSHFPKRCTLLRQLRNPVAPLDQGNGLNRGDRVPMWYNGRCRRHAMAFLIATYF